MSEGRYVWRIAFRNFLNSLRPKQFIGNNMGKDYMGNIYYEIPADPSRGKRKAQRWYDPPKNNDFEDPIPAEWESWLRQRRNDPPTEEEISKNLAISEMKKINAANLEQARLAGGGALPTPLTKGMETYPQYKDMKPGDPHKM